MELPELSTSTSSELSDAIRRNPVRNVLAGPPIHTNMGRRNMDVLSERQVMCGLELFVAYAAWDDISDRSLVAWSCPPSLTVSVGEGSGQLSTPFCAEIGFSQPFLQKVVAKAPVFEYRFNHPDPTNVSSAPSHLEIAMATFENDSFFCLLRYDLKERSSKVLLFLKAMDHLRKTPLRLTDLFAWFGSNQALLQRHPLMILNAILEFIQYEAHQYVRWRLELYSLESRLGVTRDGDSLRQGGYAEVDHDFALLNADLAGLAKKLADTELSASTILEHAKSLHRLVGLCEDYEMVALNPSEQSQAARPVTSEQREQVQATILRAELYLRNMKMAQDVLQSLSAVLYNRINKQDTDSMKTIAVVTLVFLPATFVSAIFSTGIFNFHALESPDQPRTISKYGWVYLLICLLSTTLTLASWVCWYRWGRVWLEELNFSRIYSEGKKKHRESLEARQDFKPSLKKVRPVLLNQNGTGREAGQIPPTIIAEQSSRLSRRSGVEFYGSRMTQSQKARSVHNDYFYYNQLNELRGVTGGDTS